MKPLLTILTALAIFAHAAAETPDIPADTVADIKNPAKVIVTENKSKTTVKVIGTESDPDYRFAYSITKDEQNSPVTGFSLPFIVPEKSKTRSKHQTTGFTSIYIGAVMPYNTPECFRTSIEYGVSELIGYRYTPAGSMASFGFGFGFGNRKFLIRRDMTVDCEDDAFILDHAPEGAVKVRSHLAVWNLQFPFYWRQRIHKSFGFKLTASMNLNVSVKGKSTWHEGNVKHTYKVKGLHQRIFTPELTFAIGDFGAFAAYTRWAPVKLFKHRFGPDVQSVSVGLMLGL